MPWQLPVPEVFANAAPCRGCPNDLRYAGHRQDLCLFPVCFRRFSEKSAFLGRHQVIGAKPVSLGEMYVSFPFQCAMAKPSLFVFLQYKRNWEPFPCLFSSRAKRENAFGGMP